MALRLSIIIPMHNVAPYVERCLRSLENQDIPKEDYEIICINDGSQDNSREEVLGLQKEFENIILIDQENQGVSSARNNGIDKACGDYLLFIDPDDYVDTNSFDRILKNADKQRFQVSFLGFTVLNEDGTIRLQVFNEIYATSVCTGIKAYFLSRGDGRTDPDRMWAILFKTEFLNSNKLRYLPGVPYLEDGEFIARILCLAERCVFNGHSFYQRTTRLGSATNSKLFYSDRARKGFLLAATNLKSFQQSKSLNTDQKKFLNQPICKFVVLVISSASKPFNFKRIVESKIRLRELGLKKVELDFVDGEFIRLGHFYNRSVSLLVMYQFYLKMIRFLRMRINRVVIRILKKIKPQYRYVRNIRICC